MLAQNLLTKEKKVQNFFDTSIIAGCSAKAGSQARPARVALQWLVPGTFDQVLLGSFDQVLKYIWPSIIRFFWPSIIRFFWPSIKEHLTI